MIATAAATRIDLGCGHTEAHCLKMAGELKAQLDPKYSRRASLLPIDSSFDDWRNTHRTARKRSGRAHRLGYRFGKINREAWVNDIHAINTSKPERQGRPMSAGYQTVPSYSPIPMVCKHHHVYTYGVWAPTGALSAYLWLYRSGDLAMVSSILGHADHLDNNVMYLLFQGMLDEQKPLGGTVFYNRWDSGTDGLRFFKERLGFVEGDIEWTL